MTAAARSWLTVGIALVAVALFLWSVIYLGDTVTGPRTVPVDFTPDTTPPAVP